MSGVYARKRKLSELQFYITGQELQVMVTKYALNPKHIPKKYRYTISKSLIDTVDLIMKNIIKAHSIKIKTDNDKKKKLKYQNLAYSTCWILHNEIDRAIKVIKINKFKGIPNIISLLDKEMKLIKNWSKCTMS